MPCADALQEKKRRVGKPAGFPDEQVPLPESPEKKQAPDNLLEAYEVSTAVNRVANDNARLIEKLAPGAPEPAAAPKPPARAPKRLKKDEDQTSLF